MASPEELQLLEQKSRSLQLKEDALSRTAEQQSKTEQRIKAQQESVAEKERANQLKAQDLIQRERKYNEENLQLNKERQALLQTKKEIHESKQKPTLYLIPFLLVACVVAGYFTFEHLNKKQAHFDQITYASKNIDKLANLLSQSQNQVMDKSSALQNKKTELNKTKNMLSDLKTTTDQLQSEISSLKSDKKTTDSEHSNLTTSAEILTSQLEALKAQLEDEYLTIDLYEAFIDYQEKDLEVFKVVMSKQQEILDQKDANLNEHLSQNQALEKVLAEKEIILSEKDRVLLEQESSLDRLKTKFSTIKKEFDSTKTEDTTLKDKAPAIQTIEINAQEASK